jgi:hypothetical protein
MAPMPKCQKKQSPVILAAPAPVPLAAAPAPVPLVAAPAEATEPSHLPGILVEIVGTEMSCQGRSCEMHKMCGEVMMEDVVVSLRKIQLMVEGKEEMAIAAIWVMDGIDHCHVGFVPCHMVKHAARYDGALAQVTHVFSGDPETCDSAEHRIFFKNNGFALCQSSPPCRGRSNM